MVWPGKGWVRVAAKADNLVLKGSQRKPVCRPQKHISRKSMKRLWNEDRLLSWQFLERPACMWPLARLFAIKPISIPGAIFFRVAKVTTLFFGHMLFSLFLYLSLLSTYLSTDLSVYLSICLCVYLSIYLCMYVSMYLSIYLSIYLPIYLAVYLSLYLSLAVYLSVYLFVCLSIYLSNYLSIYLSI